MSTATRYKRHKARFIFNGQIYSVEEFANKHRAASHLFIHLDNIRGGEIYISWRGTAFGQDFQELALAHGPEQDKGGVHWRVVELATGNIVIEG